MSDAGGGSVEATVPIDRWELFASETGAPRRRRPADWFFAFVSALTVGLAGWASSSALALDQRILTLFRGLPGWIDVLATIGFFAGGAYMVGLVVSVLSVGRGRKIARDLLAAIVLLGVVGSVVSRWVSGEWPDLLPEFFDVGERPTFPAARLALLTVVVATPAPHLTLPVRRFGRRMTWVVALCGLLISAADATSTIGAVALGLGVAALVHAIFGSPEGLPSTDRLRDALHQLGLPVRSVELLADQPIGVALAEAVDDHGARYLVKFHGRDAADAELAQKVWRSLWYRDRSPGWSFTGLQQVEHEAVLTLMGERRGAPVSKLATVGRDDSDNAFLVIDLVPGTRLSDVAVGDELDDRDLDAAWSALAALHRAGLSHGSLRPDVVVVEPDGDVHLEDLAAAVLSPSRREICVDRVQLVATLMAVVGVDRATASMIRSLDEEQLEETLPFLQDAVLTPELRRRIKPVGELGEVGERLLADTELVEPPKAKIRRVRASDLVLVAFGVFAVNAVLSQIAEIGFDVLWDELLGADLGWLVVAFVVGLSSAWGDVVSLRGAVTVPVPTAPTMLLQTAKSFVGLTVPTMAGRVAMDVRYLQQLGVTTTVALAQGPLISFGGFLVEVVILLVASWRVGQEVEISALSGDNLGLVLLVVVAAIVLALIVLALVPSWRAKVVPPVMEALRSVGSVVRSPRRVVRILGGQLLIRITSGLALLATLEAFDQEVSFAAAMFVAVGVGLLAGLAPVPGGVGVAEALLTSLLVAVGVPAESAFSTAITYRLVTSYLPPLLGWFSFRWLKRERYL